MDPISVLSMETGTFNLHIGCEKFDHARSSQVVSAVHNRDLHASTQARSRPAHMLILEGTFQFKIEGDIGAGRYSRKSDRQLAGLMVKVNGSVVKQHTGFSGAKTATLAGKIGNHLQ